MARSTPMDHEYADRISAAADRDPDSPTATSGCDDRAQEAADRNDIHVLGLGDAFVVRPRGDGGAALERVHAGVTSLDAHADGRAPVSLGP